MSNLNEPLTIQKLQASADDLDFDFLKGKGLEYIENMAGQLWTDYNVHDPGITILELLCYAITDLGSRIEQPMNSILAAENAGQNLSGQFFRAAQILPSAPVTEADYRKLFIDIEGVKNCWLKPYKKMVYLDCKHDKLSYDPEAFSETDLTFQRSFDLKGLYSIYVDVDEGYTGTFEGLADNIKALYHANRSLCEDLIEVNPVDTHPVSVCADIELNPDADEERVHAHILKVIGRYLSPNVRFYGLTEMQVKGYRTDEIFDGPVLQHGFIDPVELDNSALKTEVRLSDLMQVIMDVEGVKVIKDISLNDCLHPESEKESWLVCIDEGKKPALCDESVFSYYKGVLPLNINQNRVKTISTQLEEEEKAEMDSAKYDLNLKLPAAKYNGTETTTTIQNDLPLTYGTGPYGLPSRIGTERRSQALQLKGYLLFFDQILASYFAHLGKVKDLLSVDNTLRKTYFTQAVEDVRNLKKLVNNYPVDDFDKLTELLFKHTDEAVNRKNRLMDHLIARFAERFNDYVFLMKELYGSYADEVTLQTKEQFLKDYPETSRKRGSGFNYYRQQPIDLWNTANVSGLQKRIARLTGMKNIKRRNLSQSFIWVTDPDEGDETEEFKWKIKDASLKEWLVSEISYSTQRKAEKALYEVVVAILETSSDVLNRLFRKPVSHGKVAGNFRIKRDAANYTFQIINPAVEPDDPTHVLATHPTAYATQSELKDAATAFLEFLVKEFTEEGMFLIEHILLRPDVTRTDIPEHQFFPVCTENCESCEPVDPYSYRVTIVLPGWTYRFGNAEFREFMEELIRKELPAHVLAKICWVGFRKGRVADEENDLLGFEEAYRQFLLHKTNTGQEQDEVLLSGLTDKIMQLNSVYSTGRLKDCNDDTSDEDDDDALEGRIILGQTNIGNL